jgi:hypothetical protein
VVAKKKTVTALPGIELRSSTPKCSIIFIDMYALFCILFANWHSKANLTGVFPCFFLSFKANVRVYLAKTRHGPHSS